MALGVSFHLRDSDPLEASVRRLERCVTLEVRSGSNDIVFYMTSNADALALLKAVSDLTSEVIAFNAAKAAEKAVDSVTL